MKAVCALSNDTIISASRDKTVRSWIRTSPNTFSPDKVFLGHGHFVNALSSIQPNGMFPEGKLPTRLKSNILFKLRNALYRTYCFWWIRQVY